MHRCRRTHAHLPKHNPQSLLLSHSHNSYFIAGTPNGWKASIALKEMQYPHKVQKITLSENKQKEVCSPQLRHMAMLVCDTFAQLRAPACSWAMRNVATVSCCGVRNGCANTWSSVQDWFLRINPNGRIPAIGAQFLLYVRVRQRSTSFAC